MVEAFKRHLAKTKLVPPGTATLVATSGGVDSVVLCHLFQLAGLPFTIAHCNFQLRGEDSNLDEAFVEELAAELKVPCFSVKFETEQYARANKLSIQEAARSLRYEWFEQIRQTAGCQQIATAHHLDDSLETLLFNLTKGCGLRGLHGIPAKNGRVIRPLLFAEKKQILAFSTLNHIAYRDDNSNESDKYSRNLLRHHVVPVLQKINPGLQQTAKETMDRLLEAEQLMDIALASITEDIFEKRSDEWQINLDRLRPYPAQATILFELLKPFGFNNDQVGQIQQSIGNQPGKRFYAPPYQLVVDRTLIIISKQENAGGVIISIGAASANYPLPDGGEIRLSLPLELPPSLDQGPAIAYLDFERLSFPLTLRHWRAGDVFQPIGMHGRHQKLQDFFSNLKLSLLEKERVWVLESGGEIAWVVGMRLDERFKVTDMTNQAVKMEYLPNNKDKTLLI